MNRAVTGAVAPFLAGVEAACEAASARWLSRNWWRSQGSGHASARTCEGVLKRGRVHPCAEVERWCRNAGLGKGELITLNAPARALGALIHHRTRRDDAGATDTR